MSARNDYGRIARNLPGRLAALTSATADAALGAMRASMAAPKHGVHYPTQPTRSSAPGESPAVQDPDAGLAAELHRVPLADGDQAVASGTAYAADLEYGTVDGRVAARPFMAPAVRAGAPRHRAALARLPREAARGR